MKRHGAVMAVVTYVALAALVVPTAAFASSYWSTVSFSKEVKGATRSYGGSTLRISMTAGSSGEKKGNDLVYNVSAYRDKPWPVPGQFIPATAVFPRNGTGSAKWSTGSGKYYFHFKKADDGATVYSNNVHMYN